MDLLLLGKEPVSAGQPTGTDVRYDPEFDELQAEIDKLSSPSATEGTDWKKVSDISSTILAEKSKDILVAGYLSVSQVHLNKIEGLETGLIIYSDLIETFWDGLYPVKKRMRGRIGAIDWWIEKTQTALSLIKPEPVPQQKKEALLGHLDKIDKLFVGYLDEPPFIRDLQRTLEGLPSTTQEKPAVPETKPIAAAPSGTQAPVVEKPMAAAPQPGVEEMETDADAQKILASGFQTIGKASGFLIKSSPVNPQGYRFARMAVWAPIDSLPIMADGSKTIIPAPDPQSLNTIKELKEKGDYPNLLEFSESKLSEFIFWLDLNRYSCEAMTGLGGPYENAKEGICQETAGLLQRLPGLERLLFADGTPFADDETKAWLKGIGFGDVSTIMEPVTVTPSGADGQETDMMAEQIVNVQNLAKKKKLPEAIELLQNNIRASFSKKETLLWRLALSQILISSKKAKMALPHLEQILCEIDEFKLELWDPDLALKTLKAIMAGFKAHTDTEIKSRATDILGRIAKLDAVEAFKLGK